MLQGNSGGQLLTAPERTKQLDQSGNDSVVGVSGGKSKVGCCKEQYCTGTWNVRLMNQGKLDMVKQEMARMNINKLEFSELKWKKIDKFIIIQMTIISTIVAKNPLD